MEKRELAVLDTSLVARNVASKLALPIHKKGDDESEAILLIVNTKKDIELIEWSRSIRKVVGVLAWELPEKFLLELLEIEIPVLVGHVGPEQLKALVKWGGQKVSNDSEREKAQRLAAIEGAFEDTISATN